MALRAKEGVELAQDKEQDEKILQILKDAGCEPETVTLFLKLCEDGKTGDQLCLLAKHRKNLLTEIHREQAKLDCLDYLIYQIKKRKRGSKS